MTREEKVKFLKYRGWYNPIDSQYLWIEPNQDENTDYIAIGLDLAFDIECKKCPYEEIVEEDENIPPNNYTEQDLINSFSEFLELIKSNNINIEKLNYLKTKIYVLVRLFWEYCDPPDDEDIIRLFLQGYFEPENLEKLKQKEIEENKATEKQSNHYVKVGKRSEKDIIDQVQELIKNCPF